MEILESHPFHITRDADIAIKELEAEDLLETIEEGVRQRRFGSVIRLMVIARHAAADSGDSDEESGGRAGRCLPDLRPLSLKRLDAL